MTDICVKKLAAVNKRRIVLGLWSRQPLTKLELLLDEIWSAWTQQQLQQQQRIGKVIVILFFVSMARPNPRLHLMDLLHRPLRILTRGEESNFVISSWQLSSTCYISLLLGFLKITKTIFQQLMEIEYCNNYALKRKHDGTKVTDAICRILLNIAFSKCQLWISLIRLISKY